MTQNLASMICGQGVFLRLARTSRSQTRSDADRSRNILFDGERLWLIDWESAHRNNPPVDAAIHAGQFCAIASAGGRVRRAGSRANFCNRRPALAPLRRPQDSGTGLSGSPMGPCQGSMILPINGQSPILRQLALTFKLAQVCPRFRGVAGSTWRRLAIPCPGRYSAAKTRATPCRKGIVRSAL